MTHKEIHDYILSFPKAWLDFPFGEDTSVYKIGRKEDGEGRMFALIAEKSNPLRISLKCDPILAVKLRETYETVLPGYHLSKKHWNTVICTGQVPDEELKGFITLSYNLVNDTKFES
ncbi:MAG: MmcQ/YjbR family DNA-binding protein [Candidatus Saccharibacteria bacterium]